MAQSQNETLRQHLTANPGRWFSLPFLAKLTGAFAIHSRVNDLRQKWGMNVENHVEVRIEVDGSRTCLSSYRYVPQNALNEN